MGYRRVSSCLLCLSLLLYAKVSHAQIQLAPLYHLVYEDFENTGWKWLEKKRTDSLSYYKSKGSYTIDALSVANMPQRVFSSCLSINADFDSLPAFQAWLSVAIDSGRNSGPGAGMIIGDITGEGTKFRYGITSDLYYLVQTRTGKEEWYDILPRKRLPADIPVEYADSNATHKQWRLQFVKDLNAAAPWYLYCNGVRIDSVKPAVVRGHEIGLYCGYGLKASFDDLALQTLPSPDWQPAPSDWNAPDTSRYRQRHLFVYESIFDLVSHNISAILSPDGLKTLKGFAANATSIGARPQSYALAQVWPETGALGTSIETVESFGHTYDKLNIYYGIMNEDRAKKTALEAYYKLGAFLRDTLHLAIEDLYYASPGRSLIIKSKTSEGVFKVSQVTVKPWKMYRHPLFPGKFSTLLIEIDNYREALPDSAMRISWSNAIHGIFKQQIHYETVPFSHESGVLKVPASIPVVGGVLTAHATPYLLTGFDYAFVQTQQTPEDTAVQNTSTYKRYITVKEYEDKKEAMDYFRQVQTALDCSLLPDETSRSQMVIGSVSTDVSQLFAYAYYLGSNNYPLVLSIHKGIKGFYVQLLATYK